MESAIPWNIPIPIPQFGMELTSKKITDFEIVTSGVVWASGVATAKL